jgi:hypothetical protein
MLLDPHYHGLSRGRVLSRDRFVQRVAAMVVAVAKAGAAG